MGVQKLPLEAIPSGDAVERVAADRMADRGKVDTNLMGPPGLEHDPQQRGVRQQALDLEMRPRGPGLIRLDRHLQPVARVATDRRIDRARAGGNVTVDQREVLAPQPPRGKQRLQAPVDRIALGDDEQPGGVAVEPVDDPGPDGVLPTGRAPRERLRQRPGDVAPGGVDDDSRRLVDDQQAVVLVGDPEINALDDRPDPSGAREPDLDELAGPDHVPLGPALPVHQHIVCVDQALGAGAGAEWRCQESVQALPGGLLGDRQLDPSIAHPWLPLRAPTAAPAPRK